jgi:hypothetical protein
MPSFMMISFWPSSVAPAPSNRGHAATGIYGLVGFVGDAPMSRLSRRPIAYSLKPDLAHAFFAPPGGC